MIKNIRIKKLEDKITKAYNRGDYDLAMKLRRELAEIRD